MLTEKKRKQEQERISQIVEERVRQAAAIAPMPAIATPAPCMLRRVVGTFL